MNHLPSLVYTCSSLSSHSMASSVATLTPSQASQVSTLLEEDEDDEGRIPTPILRPSAANRRHHLDRTTPMVGGALLTSPPRPAKKGQQAESEDSYQPIAGQVDVSQSSPEPRTKGKLAQLSEISIYVLSIWSFLFTG